MDHPLQITFKNMDSSADVEDTIRQKVAKLEKFCDHIVSCHVVVEAPSHSHNKGGHYRVAVNVAVPNEELVVSRDPNAKDSHEDIFIAIRDSFRAAEREVKSYNERRKDYRSHD
jgi:ribosomal subunit interface protein